MLVATPGAGDALPDDLDGRHPAVGELILDRDAVAVALPGGGRARARPGAPDGAAAASGPRVVVVLGFHRSGTSMTTQLLHRLGADVGPLDGLLAADALDNPRGYWEPRRLIELNDPLLAALGGSAIDPPRLEPAGTATRRSTGSGSRPRRGCRARSATRRSGRSRTRGCA